MKQELKHLKFTLIGPMVHRHSNSMIGGANVSFENLLDYFNNQGYDFNTVNTQQFFGKFSNVLNAFYAMIMTVIVTISSDVVFLNASQNGIKYLGPFLCIYTRIFGKKVIVRPFGGAMKEHYESYSGWRKYLFEQTILKADIFYVQTRALYEYFNSLSGNVKQLPTARTIASEVLIKKDGNFRKRFVYVGRIHRDKGIAHLTDVIQEIDDTYTIHLFGQIEDTELSHLKDKSYYHGLLKPDEVLSTLSGYDVLVLPTYYKGEGYPGVIIEAYSLGLPVIATNWNSIPELIQNNKSGLLIEPRSTASLRNAITSIDNSNYKLMSKNAYDLFRKSYELNTVMDKMEEDIIELFNAK